MIWKVTTIVAVVLPIKSLAAFRGANAACFRAPATTFEIWTLVALSMRAPDEFSLRTVIPVMGAVEGGF